MRGMVEGTEARPVSGVATSTASPSSSLAGGDIGQDCDALYVGEVVHQRSANFNHRLRYSLYMLLLDIDRIEATTRRLRLLSQGRSGLMSFSARDHGDRSDTPLRAQIETHLAAAGIDLQDGTIRLLTMPRILGYGFNPISVYFCYRPDGQVAALVYEVTNTFHERHSYLVAVPEDAPPGPLRQTTEKRFFVSPYMDMALTYDFTVRLPGEAVSVVVAVRRGSTPILTASFVGRRRPLTDGEMLRAFVTHPLLTWKVTAGIHWEALKMMVKGARYRHRGSVPSRPVSLGHGR
ncbi:MAG: DUF1365 family protein [Caulobacteraceae bacterium]|nr:DUF1365 family protein [Caulobacteraceae bacterium]